MVLGIWPTIDFVFKLLYGQPANADLLLHLLNAVLQWETPIVQVEILNPFRLKKWAKGKISIVDVKARDSLGRLYTIEIQTTLPFGLANRWVYYACGLYFEQMQEGQSYGDLRPAVCISIVTEVLFPQTPATPLRFVLHDPQHQMTLGDQLQIHVVELPKFRLDEATIAQATPLEQLAFFLRNAGNYNARTLRKLLPGAEFHKGIGVLEMVARSPSLKVLHDDRAKAELDRFSALKDAREAGLLEGELKGELKGKLEGELKGRLMERSLLMQEMLGEIEYSEEVLSQLPLPELQKLARQIERRWKRER